jgi:1-acyl-sn-glycerol-3-phosphate acyltransferase
MKELADVPISTRKNIVFFMAKNINLWGYKYLGNSYCEVHEKIHLLKETDSVFLYASLHKSLWETTGILAALYNQKLPVPYTGMGDNLVRGKFFQNLSQKAGVFLIKRPTNRREVLESAKLLKEYLITHFANGKDVMFFPEGTRKSIISSGEYGQFFPAAFDAIQAYEREKEEIVAHYKDLKSHNAYIIPTNVDYSKIREDLEMLKTYKGKPRTLHVLDSLTMFQKIGDTYVTFGEPMKVSDYLDTSRKELAILTRKKCLELVKILPINIASRAILDSIQDNVIDTEAIEENIKRNIEQLKPHQNNFRSFSPDDDPKKILETAGKYERRFRYKYIDIKEKSLYRFYSDFIGHYYS